MRIAQVAPLFESVPPKLYGGTERVVSYLSEALVEMGHDVTLFASGDSVSSAELQSCCKEAIRLNPKCVDPWILHVLQLEKVLQRAEEFDILHFHTDYFHFPSTRNLDVPHLSTLHGRLDFAELELLYREYDDVPLVSISNSQRKPIPWANWIDTVLHGLPRNLLKPNFESGKYLAFLGRFSPEKRPDRAIEIAKRVGLPLKLAAKVDVSDRPYFDSVVKPLLNDPLIEYVGEINESQKEEFLGNAMGLLFPIDWEEPFGLVMIESMACATPVIAYSRGSVPEVMENSEAGFVVDSISSAVEAVKRLPQFDRRRCRTYFERRFDARRMADDYIRAYSSVIDQKLNWGELKLSEARLNGRYHPGSGPVLRSRNLVAR